MDPAPRKRWILGPLLLVAAVAAIGWWLLRDHEERGVVADMRWTHTTQLQRWTDVVREGWRDELVFHLGAPPIRGAGEVPAVLIGACRERHRRDETYACGDEAGTRRERYHCGSERRCERARVGSGAERRVVERCHDVPRQCFRDVPYERTRRCTRAVTGEWCEYRTQEWVPVRSERIEGDAHLGMRFPELPPAGDDERSLTSASYAITFTARGGPHTAIVERAEYDRWNPGDPVILRLEAASGLLAYVKPTPAAPPR